MSATLPSLLAVGYLTTCPVPCSVPGTAVSRESQVLTRSLAAVQAQHDRSVALNGPKLALMSNLAALMDEHGQPNWDSEGAAPLSPLAARQVMALIRVLPDHLPLPELTPEADGCISLDWIATRHRCLTVSVDATGSLPMAWINNGNRGHGVVMFDGSCVPADLLLMIGHITGAGNATQRAA
jgi:hypothetical protein